MQNPLVSSSSLALALCSSVFAQTVKYETSPPGHVTRFNHDFYTQLGIWPKGRLHQGDGELMKRMAITRMDYRLDPAADYRFTPSRKWTSVVLTLAETTLPLNTRFSNNYATTPQTVFSGPMSWTRPGGAYPTPPANTQTIPWGSHGVAFPFTSVFMYSGTKPMLREYVFRGGTLSNTATWTTNSTFFLDGIENKNTGGAERAVGHAINNTDCADSIFIIKNTSAGAGFKWTNHASTYSVASLRGKTELITSSAFTRPGFPVIHALGPPLTNPINLGAACNPLYISPVIYLFLTAQGGSSSPGRVSSPPIRFPMIPSTFNQRAGIQAAWTDNLKGFALTGAFLPTLPGAPRTKLLAKQTAWRNNPDTAFATIVTGNADCPRFCYK